MQHRNHSKPTTSLEERLAAFAKEARDRAIQLPPGPERDALLKKAEQAETVRPQDWISSRDLQPPKQTER